jgi:hypothetical protein
VDYDSVLDVFTNTHVTGTENYITADIARFGNDNTVIRLWRGLSAHDRIVMEQSIVPQVVDKIKQLARQNNVPMSRIIVDEDGIGLCLKSKTAIKLRPHQERRLWEYSGDSTIVTDRENSNTIPLTQLKYGCEYTHNGIHYRKFPRGPLDSLTKFMQAPSPNKEPNCYLSFDPRRNEVHVVLKKSIGQHEKYTIDYGLAYWQLFWHHLSIPHQRQLKELHRDIKFPPLWPPQLPDICSQENLRQEEWNYAIASKNIYDELENSSSTESPITVSTDAQEEVYQPEQAQLKWKSDEDHLTMSQPTSSQSTTMTQLSNIRFDPIHWYKRTSDGVDWDHLIRVIDTAFRTITVTPRHVTP